MPLRQPNAPLNIAQANQDDEFYTPRTMIEAELAHYSKSLFKGKRILCNCDDPGESSGDRHMSAFFEYFDDNFTSLGLRQLVGIRYSGSALWKGIRGAAAYTRTVTANKNGKKQCARKRDLRGDSGGFEGREGKRQLKNCDIVVTNPPFSKFHEFMELLMASGKKFIVIGNINAMTLGVFPLIQSGKVWLGAARCKGEFVRPEGNTPASAPSCWYTNLPHDRHERKAVALTAKYSAKNYPRYDNYPAIEVGRVKKIPADYCGEMGVPITFLEKHNPLQFDVVGRDIDLLTGRSDRFYINGNRGYSRIIIRRADATANWKETKDLERRSTFGNAGGFVYVAVIPGDSGWFKIGKTNTYVADRVKRDSFSRKKPKVVMALEVADAGMAEKQVHDALQMYRKKGTEFFNPPRKELESVLTQLAQKRIRLWR